MIHSSSLQVYQFCTESICFSISYSITLAQAPLLLAYKTSNWLPDSILILPSSILKSSQSDHLKGGSIIPSYFRGLMLFWEKINKFLAHNVYKLPTFPHSSGLILYNQGPQREQSSYHMVQMDRWLLNDSLQRYGQG